MPFNWSLRPCAAACHLCGTAFADRQTLHSRLLFTREGYDRQDYCLDCWPRRAADPDASPAATEVSDWTHDFHAPPPKAAPPVQRESAEALLRQLIETDDPAQAAPLFVLAVMLERRRIFVERQVALQPDGRRLRLYEHRKTGETFLIPDPNLRLADLEPVQLQVLSLLSAPPNPAPLENQRISQ
ncbi:hypothetical protein J6U76_00090 [bacterium]|nr:hypothetical protein [bacterium]